MKRSIAMVGYGIAVVLVMALIVSAAISFLASPTINPSTPRTNTTLQCRWTVTGTGTILANVTWYQNDVLNATETSIPCTSGQVCQTQVGINGSNVRRYNLWNCTVNIADNTNNATANVQVNISNGNPLITTIPNPQTIYEDQLYTYDVNATDPDAPGVIDGDGIHYSTTEVNNLSSAFETRSRIASATGLFNFTPLQADVGNHTLEIAALDGEPVEGSYKVQILFQVIEVNDAPQITNLINFSALEGTAFTYQLAATDEENDAINFSTNATFFNVSTSGLMTFTPTSADVGNHTIFLTVLDNRSGNRTYNTSMRVNSTNHAPTLLTIANQSAVQGQLFTLNVYGYDDFRDNDTVTFSDNVSLFDISTVINLSNATANATGLISFTPSNSMVGNHSVKITLTDSRTGTDTKTFTLQINNTNDAPTIEAIPNQTTAESAPFSYQINATDVDIVYGDSITYSDNTSLFNINSTTGLINFTSTALSRGNYSIRITVTDTQGASASTTMNMEIRPNNAPVIQGLGNLTANEDQLFTSYLQGTDADGDNITFTTNATFFSISIVNGTSGLINFTANNSLLGNTTPTSYPISITATDSYGAIHTQNITFFVNNTNDAPVFPNITMFPQNQSQPAVVVGQLFVLFVAADDEDLRFGDNLTYTNNGSLFTIENYNRTHGRISFVPTASDANGQPFYDHAVNLTARDLLNSSGSTVLTFRVYAASSPPNITTFFPFETNDADNTFIWQNTSPFLQNHTALLSIPENFSVSFNFSYTDNDTAAVNLTFNWYLDGVLQYNGTADGSHNWTWVPNFTNAGSHQINMTLMDRFFYSNDYWLWNVTVTDVNRLPVLNGTLSNKSTNRTLFIENYFTRFLDPDGDSLTFNWTNTTFSTLSVQGNSLTITPINNGTDYIVFTASDGKGGTATSNNVTIIIIATNEDVGGGSGGSSSGGGGGSPLFLKGASRKEKVIVQTIKQENIFSNLELVVPEPITIYENNTIEAPITLRNTGDRDLSGISLKAIPNAVANDSSFSLRFTTSSVNFLGQGDEAKTTLIITSYRAIGNYEIKVQADVDEPEFSDSAVIYINSLESSAQNNTQVTTKITFTRDLLRQNPQCLELEELLDEASRSLEDRDYAKAQVLIDSVLTTCKYLVAQAGKNIEIPKSPSLRLAIANRTLLIYGIAIGIPLLLLLGGFIYYKVHMHSRKKRLQNSKIHHLLR
ncbi:hypothetical protein HZB01_00640 [Candidatus Woesearchaeota archaeon]|nr:hypothetical protein [Candidatus Woesearchaeota archaeon]